MRTISAQKRDYKWLVRSTTETFLLELDLKTYANLVCNSRSSRLFSPDNVDTPNSRTNQNRPVIEARFKYCIIGHVKNSTRISEPFELYSTNFYKSAKKQKFWLFIQSNKSFFYLWRSLCYANRSRNAFRWPLIIQRIEKPTGRGRYSTVWFNNYQILNINKKHINIIFKVKIDRPFWSHSCYWNK